MTQKEKHIIIGIILFFVLINIFIHTNILTNNAHYSKTALLDEFPSIRTLSDLKNINIFNDKPDTILTDTLTTITVSPKVYNPSSVPEKKQPTKPEQQLPKIGNEIPTPIPQKTGNEFIDAISPVIVKYIPNPNLQALVTAQVILESGWGKSKLARHANNFLGIKCWGCKRFHREYDDGKLAKFIKFDSFESCIKYYYDKVISKERYNDMHNIQSVSEGLLNLEKGGYATNKKYRKLLLRIIKKHNLVELYNATL